VKGIKESLGAEEKYQENIILFELIPKRETVEYTVNEYDDDELALFA